MTQRANLALNYDSSRLEAVALKLGLRLIILYGSCSNGKPPPTPESDLDVAVLDSQPPSPQRFMALYREISQVFEHDELDLALLNETDPLFRYEIMRGGTLLYGNQDEFLEYKAFAFRDFVDSGDLRRLEELLFQKKMELVRRELYDTP